MTRSPSAAALLITLLFAGPLLVGILGTLAPAFGLGPFSLEAANQNGAFSAFNTLFEDPRFWPSIWLSVKTGVIATVLVLLLTLLTLVCVYRTRLWHWLGASLPPLLAVPHAALAVGLVFLISPSGWLARIGSPGLTGWHRPPTDWVVPDAGGWTLIAGLVIKETPFLLLAAIAQLSSLKVAESLSIGQTLGYAPARCWSRLILPGLYRRIRLTLFIILAFNLSVVDMAVLLGPGNPPTFSVFLLSLVNDPGARAVASAGSLLLCAIVALSFAAVFCLERVVASVAGRRRVSGKRGRAMAVLRKSGQSVSLLLIASSLLSLLLLVMWSVTKRWRYPAALPSEWSLINWTQRSSSLLEPLATTVGFALVTMVVAMAVSIWWLELERFGQAPRIDWLWYVPLLIPQVTLMFGWQALALWSGTDGAWLTVCAAHWIYAMPYVILILAVAWREVDPNWNHAASVLGAGYWKVFFRVRLPLLARPLCQAAAVALAVSVAQYLPTLLLGAGRYQTLAIELVTSFGGVDRRSIAMLAVMQSILPLLAFTAALFIPLLLTRTRSQLVPGGDT